MTPKEKADELYNKFYAWYPKQDAEFIAVECALLAVKEVLNVLFQHHEIDYWKEVQSELKKY